MLTNDQLSAWDRDSFMHPSTHLGQFARGEMANRILTGGSGVYLDDRDGNRLLDAFAGLYCVNVGYGRTPVIEAIAEQARNLAYYHAYVGHGTEASITLSHEIVSRLPESLGMGKARVYYGLSGSDANETNVKLVWYYNNVLGRPEKKKIISRWRGYHGSGLMTGSLTGLLAFQQKFDLPLPYVKHTEAPYYYRRPDAAKDMSEAEFSAWCAEQLDALIVAEGPETVAAFIGEPALGTGGLVLPPEGYWEAIQAVLEKHDVLLIADEVVTGFGRLGRMFGSDLYGMTPDIMTIAKGLTSAYAPLSGSIVAERIFDVLMKGNDDFGGMGHGWTYSAHPIGAAAGVANLALIDDMKLVDNAATVGRYLREGLMDAIGDHPNVGEIRGKGLMGAVELVADREDRRFFEADEKVGPRVVAAMLEQSVIARAMPQGDIIGIAPPLCLTPGEADVVIAAVRKSIADVLGKG